MSLLFKIMNFEPFEFMDKFEQNTPVARQCGSLIIKPSRTKTNDQNWVVKGVNDWNGLGLYSRTFKSFYRFKAY